MRFLRFFLILYVAAFWSSCGRTERPASVEPEPGRSSARPAPGSRDADDAGRFLAGLQGKHRTSFADLERQEAWKRHRDELDRAWGRFEADLLPGMRAFQKKELSGTAIENATVFYPFSGPDALMLTVFFPNNPMYVMVGLEPPGTLPKPKDIATKDLDGYLADIRETVASELHRSFFITREMDRQFRGQVSDGLCPAILHLLVRANNTVQHFRYVRLDEQGRIVERAADYKAPGRIGNKGVEISFQADSGGPARKLYYFSVNLSDERLRENRPFLEFLSRLSGSVTFFKSTSYMPHNPGFSIMRERVLAYSTAILQDDSGIPYRFFDEARWSVRLYGSYERPYGSFRWLEQPDLRKAYETSSPRPLGFRIGYGFSRIPSNLLLAVRKR